MVQLHAFCQFTCPQCGGHSFGSTRDEEKITYHCQENAGCKFSFPIQDFWKYQVITTKERFGSKQEYDKWKGEPEVQAAVFNKQ